jgi:hypothetical protein
MTVQWKLVDAIEKSRPQNTALTLYCWDCNIVVIYSSMSACELSL